MKVVLDTNIIVADFQMTGSTFTVFLEKLDAAGHSHFILEIVIDEAANKFRERLIEAEEELNRGAKKIRRLVGESAKVELNNLDIPHLVEEYRKKLIANLEKSAFTSRRRVFHPRVFHDEIIDRCLRRRKPFSADGRVGYRDTLIWYNLLWIAETYAGGEPIAFITNNVQDFANESVALHPDLQQDLLEKGLDVNSIVIYSNLSAFVSEQISGQFERLDELITNLNLNQIDDFDFPLTTIEVLNEELQERQLVKIEKVLPLECLDPVLKSVKDIESYTVKDARRIDGMSHTTTLLSAELIAICEVSFHVSKATSIFWQRQNLDIVSIADLDSPYNEIVAKIKIPFSLTLSFHEDPTDISLQDADILITP